MNIASWNKETRQAFVGVLVYAVFGIVSGLLGNVKILKIIAELSVVCGYIIFFLAAKDLIVISEGEDKKAFEKVYIASVLAIVGAILSIFSLKAFMLIGGICNIVAAILLLIAYKALKDSKTIAEISADAAAGFKQLFTAELLVVIALCLALIPVVGLVGGILAAIAFVLVLLGWYKVAKPVAAPGEEPVAAKPIFETVKQVVAESVVEAKEVAQDMAGKAKVVAEEVSDKAKEVSGDIKEKIAEKKAEAAEVAEEAAEKVETAAEEVAETAAETAETAADTVAEATKTVAETAADTVAEATKTVAETAADAAAAVEDAVKPE